MGSGFYSQLFHPSSDYPEDGSRFFLQQVGARVRSLKLRIQEGKWIYYIKNQRDATLALLFISNCKITLQVSDAFCAHHQEY